ncbi:protein VACUOLELESS GAMETOPHYTES-like [Salvia miltiorrhiza]|uniref:protein VACUOLELESS GAMETOPHYTES-like n=1 Tax=Salvia miltiorrhiza TaxID=226208 RepID=UPI0025AD1E5C|nr:protein VACUOLELESS GAMETOPHYTES-like [Salvia miltiorrhiza]
MSREKEGEMEKESIPHIFHQHPLSLIPNRAAETDNSWSTWCYGCWRYFLPGEAAYGCSQKCGMNWLLHKECMEMPREIRHPLHPSHSLTLQDSSYAATRSCAVCEFVAYGLLYKCSGGCEWWIHFGCTGDFEAAVVDDSTMKHPSHPQHQLIKKTRWCSFPCDACGATHKGKSYICTLCDYWLHETCALLPVSAPFPHHRPDHYLSLAFNLPYEYIKYEFVCAICSETLPMRRWVYHCQLCRYVVHINCATNTSSLSLSNSSNNENAIDDAKDITKGPIDDIYEEIIRPFVKRERTNFHHS